MSKFSKPKSPSTTTGYSTCSRRSTLTITKYFPQTNRSLPKNPPPHSNRTICSATCSNKPHSATKTLTLASRSLFWWLTLAASFTPSDLSQMGWSLAGNISISTEAWCANCIPLRKKMAEKDAHLCLQMAKTWMIRKTRFAGKSMRDGFSTTLSSPTCAA